ncbi:DUF6443 domain-containing protein [Aquimarina pacifica]|uniref:DUF6443 domain-containing protein n=1 Tax=Aquimarina pacifica TaxID=1296415 RepID=UPI00046FDBAF|nr:DUF6443 domain-containing protein [Aquimarina pacifica]
MITKIRILVLVIFVLNITSAIAQTVTENYVKTTIYQNEVTADASASATDKLESIQYIDGLGRPKLSVEKGTSPNQKDIVTPIIYDDFGRQVKDYLPYEASNGTGIYRSSAVNEAASFYNTTEYENTTNPYSEKLFEASPLSRVLKQAAPGSDWALGNGHEIEFDYQTNGLNEVIRFDVVFTNDDISAPTLFTNGYYDKGTLTKTIVRDENHTSATSKDHTTEEFKDKQGRVVLKRTYESEVPHDTHYVYDDFGNLTYVLPPDASQSPNFGGSVSATLESTAVVNTDETLDLVASELITLKTGFNAKTGSVFSAIISDEDSGSNSYDLCYQYKYDHRNRLVEKKIPGKGWEYIVYNTLDQPVLTQDANLRENNHWLFTKYDAFDRVAFTGLHIHSSAISREAMQALADNTTAYTQYVTRTNTVSTIADTEIYYTNGAIPHGVSEIYIINYYDNYGFDTALPVAPTTAFDQSITTNTRGLVTGSKVRVLGTDYWITTATYYDKKARPIYVYSSNEYLETTDITMMELNFTGNVLQTQNSHKKGDLAEIIVRENFTYDHAGRLLTHYHQIGNQTSELLVSNDYNKLGKLETKAVGNTIANPLQEINYAYNIRGWLTKINDPNTTLTDDLFAFKINYNTTDLTAATEPLYNGNISETHWKTLNDNRLRNYSYLYDGLGRLTYAGNLGTSYNVYGITYDKMGNIQSLRRNGATNIAATSFGTMDNLSYTYDTGSKLLKVSDSSGSTEGFNDKNTAGDDYTYDANGNLTSDANKGITTIGYNHLNLPTYVNVPTGGRYSNALGYTYDALGNKLSKNIYQYYYSKTFYAGNIIYKENPVTNVLELQYIKHAEGYLEPVNGINATGGFTYSYQHKDHLGNIRLSYEDTNNDGNISVSEIKEEKNYYPFGLQHRGYNATVVGREHPYGYNGKEEQEDLGLDWLDFSARHYNAAIGRWMNIDPLAEQMRRHSAYNFAFDNPVYFIDPDGMAPDGPPDDNHFSPFKNSYVGRAIESSLPSGPVFEGSVSIQGKLGPGIKGEVSLGKNVKAGVDLAIAEGSATLSTKDGGTLSAKGSILSMKGSFVAPGVGTAEFGGAVGEVNGSINANGEKTGDVALGTIFAKGETENGVSVNESATLVSSNEDKSFTSSGETLKSQDGGVGTSLKGDVLALSVNLLKAVKVSVSANLTNLKNNANNAFTLLGALIMDSLEIPEIPDEEGY